MDLLERREVWLCTDSVSVISLKLEDAIELVFSLLTMRRQTHDEPGPTIHYKIIRSKKAHQCVGHFGRNCCSFATFHVHKTYTKSHLFVPLHKFDVLSFGASHSV